MSSSMRVPLNHMSLANAPSTDGSVSRDGQQGRQPPVIILTPPSLDAAPPQLLVRPLPPTGKQPRRSMHQGAPQQLALPPPPDPVVRSAPVAIAQRVSSRSPGLNERRPARAWPAEPSSIECMQVQQVLFIANPEPSAPAPTPVTHPKPTARAPAPAKLTSQPAAARISYETSSLHQVARSGPFEALETVIALNPQALVTRDRLRAGGHMPLTLAVMSRDSRHVNRLLKALGEADCLEPAILDAPGTDGRCALAVAIDINGQHQVEELLQVGASPLLPIPQKTQGVAQAIKKAFERPSANAAEYAVRRSRPYILTLLLEWDERDAARRQSRRFTFAIGALTELAQRCGSKINTSALRCALGDAAVRRRSPPRAVLAPTTQE